MPPDFSSPSLPAALDRLARWVRVQAIVLCIAFVAALATFFDPGLLAMLRASPGVGIPLLLIGGFWVAVLVAMISILLRASSRIRNRDAADDPMGLDSMGGLTPYFKFFAVTGGLGLAVSVLSFVGNLVTVVLR